MIRWLPKPACLLFALMLCASTPGYSQSSQTESGHTQSELSKVTSLYLYNYFKLGQWSSRDRFIFCVVGDEPVAKALRVLLRKKSIDHPVVFKRTMGMLAVQSCNILYLGKGVRDSVAKLGPLADTLVVADRHRGADIDLFTQGNNLVFHINYEKVKSKQITLGARLLSLSKEYP